MAIVCTRAFPITIVTFVTLPGSHITAFADESGSYWGYGKTYQDNQVSVCHWYDTAHNTMSDKPCYKGVWSDTMRYNGIFAKVVEFAQQFQYCTSGGNFCHVTYTYFRDMPYDQSSQWGYISTNSIHYYCGALSCNWPVNVIGYAYHYGPNGSDYIYTQSMWGSQYVY